MTFPIVGPVPPYTNPPIEPQNYQPRSYLISAITLGVTTLVTATTDMDYVIGQLVRLVIPENCGSRQLNQQSGYVLSVPQSNQVEIGIDSSNGVNQFIFVTSGTQAQILPVGDVNTGAINNSGRISNSNLIQGSFINIS